MVAMGIWHDALTQCTDGDKVRRTASERIPKELAGVWFFIDFVCVDGGKLAWVACMAWATRRGSRVSYRRLAGCATRRPEPYRTAHNSAVLTVTSLTLYTELEAGQVVAHLIWPTMS